MADTLPRPETAEADRGHRGALRYVEEALRGLQYCVLTIIVQDGVVVQVERTEKVRLAGGDRGAQS